MVADRYPVAGPLTVRTVRPEAFGAKGDWTDTSATLGTGTDDTAAFQAAIDYLIANDGQVLELSGKYLINGTVYINPPANPHAVPITIRGLTGNPFASRGRGTAIIRTVAGDIFRVNTDSSGNGVISSTTQFHAFAVENLSFIGKSVTEGVVVTGINAIRAHRTRLVAKNLHASRLDYLIYQPDTDASAVDNYCDQSIYENLRIVFSTKSGARLCRNDSGKVQGFYFEDPLTTVEHGLELSYGSGMSVDGVLLHGDPALTYSPVAGSSMLLVSNVRGLSLSGLHLERTLPFECAIDVFGSYAVNIRDVYTVFAGNTFLKNRNSIGTSIDRWYGWEDRQAGTYDIQVTGTTSANKDVTWGNVYLTAAYPSTTLRAISTSGAAGQSDDAMSGLPRQAYEVINDADRVLTRAGRAYQLPGATAHRTLTLPTPSLGSNETWLYLVCRNTTTFRWDRSGPQLRRPDGTDIASIPNQVALFAIWDDTNSVWRVVSAANTGTVDSVMVRATTARTASATLASTEDVVRGSAAGGAITLTLPTAVGVPGRCYTVKKTDSSGNAVTVGTTSSQTIDGSTTYSLASQYKYVTVISDGANWSIIGNN